MRVPRWFDAVVFDSAALAALIVVLGFVALIALGLRRRGITRHAGTFECCVRAVGRTRFSLAMARYGGDRLEVFRWFSLSYRAHAVFERSLIVETGRRKPVGREVMLLGAGEVVVLEFSYDGQPAALALGQSALTGFLAWIEAAPPRSMGG
jgi:hypothetical protein